MEHRDIVGHREGVPQLVGDQDDGIARIGIRSHPSQQLLRLLGSEHRGGLIQNEQAHVARERLHDFAALLGADGEVLDAGKRIEHQTRLGCHGAHPRGRAVGIEESRAAERNILRDGHRGHQREMLMHHADPRGKRIGGRAELHRRALPAHDAARWCQRTEGDSHQRRLPCPVFAEQRVYAPRAHRERRILERGHGAETTRDPLECECHEPVGRCRKVQGSPKRASSHSPSACTPSVSVA